MKRFIKFALFLQLLSLIVGIIVVMILPVPNDYSKLQVILVVQGIVLLVSIFTPILEELFIKWMDL